MTDKEKSLENLLQMFEVDVTDIKEYIISMRLNLALMKCEQIIKSIDKLRRREKERGEPEIKMKIMGIIGLLEKYETFPLEEAVNHYRALQELKEIYNMM